MDVSNETHKKNHGAENEEEDKSYLRWNIEMDHTLVNILRDQRKLGNKGPYGWKKCATNTASSVVSTRFNRDISVDNVRNRIKTWKKYYAVVNDIISQSGFHWDENKKMITVDEESAWEKYIESHKEARPFRWKVIPNWDDIVELCGKDSATEERAETAAHAIELVRKSTADDIVNLCGKDGAIVEVVADTAQKSTVDDIVDLWGKDKTTGKRVADEFTSDDHISAAHHTEDFHTIASPYSSKRKKGKSSSSSIAPLRKKKAKRNGKLVVAITKLAATFEEYMHAATLKLDATEVYEEINGVKGLGDGEELKACMLFIENEQQFRMLKALPPEKKKSFILMFLSQAS